MDPLASKKGKLLASKKTTHFILSAIHSWGKLGVFLNEIPTSRIPSGENFFSEMNTYFKLWFPYFS